MTRRTGGFSLVELLIAMALMVTFSGALLSLIVAGQSMARMQPEAADVQQRARIALQTLGAELALRRRGTRSRPAGRVRWRSTSRRSHHLADGGVTIWYVSSRRAQTTLAAPLAPGATDALIETRARSVRRVDRASFSTATDAAMCVRIDAVDAPRRCRCAPALAAAAMPPGAAIAQGEVRTYRVDPITRQLLRRDEATGFTRAGPRQRRRDDGRVSRRRPPHSPDAAAGPSIARSARA